ncbi:MAG: hypothetical protein JO361_02480 [Gammaproteobacteria bacterium]|nr:hypothetical protein [Gammaproteobacteria bacterium]
MLRALPAAGFLMISLAANAGAPGAGAAAPGALRWMSFVDPAEKGFTVEVPVGWTVKGGIFRLGFSDARGMVDMSSPDGRINVRLGDVAVPTYVAPTQYHAREGEVYDLGAQAQMVVARYRPGPEFAVLYSHARFHALCHDPKGDSTPSGISLPDVVPSEAPPDQSSSGAISYRCDTAQGPAVAFAWAKTALFKSIWGVTPLASFYAPADQVELARAVLLRSAKSFQLRPEWLQYQKQMDAQGLEYQRARQQQRMVALGQQVQQFESRMAAMRAQVSAFERHQAAQAAQVESFTNVLNGITPTIDPLTGEARTVWTGPAGRYWVNGLGDVVNSNSQPSASFHEIQPLQ